MAAIETLWGTLRSRNVTNVSRYPTQLSALDNMTGGSMLDKLTGNMLGSGLRIGNYELVIPSAVPRSKTRKSPKEGTYAPRDNIEYLAKYVQTYGLPQMGNETPEYVNKGPIAQATVDREKRKIEINKREMEQKKEEHGDDIEPYILAHERMHLALYQDEQYRPLWDNEVLTEVLNRAWLKENNSRVWQAADKFYQYLGDHTPTNAIYQKVLAIEALLEQPQRKVA
ncbi:MAG: hypothetical protein HY832_00240 [Candidatus Aenigmarchaeota archaeon]|nr:hypothetical protein [Candidatus Aenigmarchaeota archaeon]